MRSLYLSRLLLNATSRQVQADLQQPYELHRTMMRACWGDVTTASAPPAESLARGGRVLYRADLYDAAPRLLVQSSSLPDWSLLPEDYVLTAGHEPGLAVRYFAPTLERGQALAFRLRANPTQRRQGKRRAWLTRDEQQA